MLLIQLLAVALAAAVRLSVANIIPCTRSAHCPTDHHCHRPAAVCLHIPSPATVRQQSPPGITLTNRTAIVEEVNAIQASTSEKLDTIDAILKVLPMNPHLDFQRNVLNVDILAKVRHLRNSPSLPSLSNFAFHTTLQAIFQTGRDFHTAYRLPLPVTFTIALLGVELAVYYTPLGSSPNKSHNRNRRRRRIVVSDVTPQLTGQKLRIGDELLRFDGLPALQAALQAGRLSAAANPDARLARGLELLTFRVLVGASFPPRDTAALVVQAPGDAAPRHVTLPWIFAQLVPGPVASAVVNSAQPWALLRPAEQAEPADVPSVDMPSPPAGDTSRAARAVTRVPVPVSEQFRNLFSAEVVTTRHGALGRLVLPSFGSFASPALRRELVRVLKLFPPAGLIVDARNNRGGSASYPVMLAELISDARIGEMHVSGVATDASIQLVSTQLEDLPPNSSIRQTFRDLFLPARPGYSAAARNGERRTGPLQDILDSNRKRQERVYMGPTVTLVNGRTYSAGDIFSVLAKDFGVSRLIGVGGRGRTGGGGANSTPYALLSAIDPESFPPLKMHSDFSTAQLRFYRQGKRSGASVEFYGVDPDEVYLPTKRDAIEPDGDLFEKLAKEFHRT